MIDHWWHLHPEIMRNCRVKIVGESWYSIIAFARHKQLLYLLDDLMPSIDLILTELAKGELFNIKIHFLQLFGHAFETKYFIDNALDI